MPSALRNFGLKIKTQQSTSRTAHPMVQFRPQQPPCVWVQSIYACAQGETIKMRCQKQRTNFHWIFLLDPGKTSQLIKSRDVYFLEDYSYYKRKIETIDYQDEASTSELLPLRTTEKDKPCVRNDIVDERENEVGTYPIQTVIS
ncbi:hypothetical protein PR048_013170 [Dryococelus australis]|uniref:Uncharacterized protein n=1 Tax=Dryococelus australis TaxID=614101 RepID=A0ABQ9HS96_9NEOP|nr:hypothetical protein PR048_013170 [Dryococelus australis]